ncbi:hypothetical protein [Pseudoxanthomonas winnipegensis]|uniref:Uncharacterized protein n=1 Tax=Pseudoxanthomonas winnipegensis TaxID=2480810 RepID=A0A4Q8LFA2_9GAMM|nr:hypothetical protein [Pseudoxanthomonas winnipegensis]RZZ88916.1 hypothetical protein EA662_00475 [Pseudoxanthomonas winnipegensis]TAA27375.1 hypothetical protein EA661_14715 [Pseudoxanthomonas winnipegensis]TBV75661.1 hypothetical protein EYC46_10310 [Pseudoxanthomonas winnipegensis]
MTIRRIKDPAGLLPDHIHIDFDGDSADAIADLLEQMTPVARVNALRRDHPELEADASKLAAQLDRTGGNANHVMLMRLAQLETQALYLRAAPAALEVQSRRAASAKGGKARKAPAWHADAVRHARALLATGRQTHELTGLCARKFKKKDDAVRRVLQGADLVPQRKNRVK